MARSVASTPRRHKTTSRFVFLVTLAGLLSVNLFGHAGAAQITGTVYDPPGAAIPNASVTVKPVDTCAVRVETTSSRGAYIATDLLPGDYLGNRRGRRLIWLRRSVLRNQRDCLAGVPPEELAGFQQAWNERVRGGLLREGLQPSQHTFLVPAATSPQGCYNPAILLGCDGPGRCAHVGATSKSGWMVAAASEGGIAAGVRRRSRWIYSLYLPVTRLSSFDYGFRRDLPAVH